MNKLTDLFKQSKTDWLEDARDTARQLLKQQYSITIEDVLEVCPLPRFLHRNTIGRVFAANDFKPVGYESSRRTAMHGRVVRAWTMKTPGDYEQINTDLPDNWAQIRASASDGDSSRIVMVD